MRSHMKWATVAAAAMAGALIAGSQASAATVYISADHLFTSSYVVTLGGTVDGNGFGPQGVYESPDVLTVSINGGLPHDILVFCVDIFHNFSSSTPPVTYETGPVVNNSHSPASGGGVALGNLISGQIGYLATLGQAISDPERLAGIQGAIWQTEYPSLTISGGSSYVGYYQGLASTWASNHPNFSGYADGMYPTNGQSQGFGLTQGFTTGGVPEPATWAMMLAGFAGIGAALRRGRGRPALAAV